jgi:Cu+-exporting ATPase
MSASAITELQVSGMTCNNCARHVTDAIQSVPNVRSALVSLDQRRATVHWNSVGEQSVPALLASVAKAGYEARELAPAEAGAAVAGQNRWQWNLILGLSVTGALLIGEWILDLGQVQWFRWLALVLAGAVQVFAGAQFYAGAWRQLKVGQSNMDALVALGSTTAFGYSTWALLAGGGGHLYFLEAAAIISLVSFGHWLEARVSDRAGAALKSLLNLAPPTARRLAPPPVPPATTPPPLLGFTLAASPAVPKSAGPLTVGHGSLELKSLAFSPTPIREEPSASETEVPVADLRAGDRVALRPGDRVPVDGVVLEGESAVNEAMLTGESAPVDKKKGSELFAGTMNLNGRLVLRVTATGEATALAHIVAAVQRAQSSRAEIQRLGDRISSVFVPIIVVVALAAGIWWGCAPASAEHVHEWLAQFLWHGHLPDGAAAGFMVAAAVLIVACPCAMGLATPAAIMASANAAARRGILIRDGVALEKAGRITAVIFDKTGTLTTGELALAGTWTPAGSRESMDQVQALAGALAAPSSHPASRVLAAANQTKVPLTDWRELAGQGVQAQWRPAGAEKRLARLGSLSWLKEAGVEIQDAAPAVAQWQAAGATLVGLAIDNSLAGIFALRDLPRNNASAVVGQLQRQGLKAYLLTGDQAATAAAIADRVGIAADHVFAGVRPEQKADFVKQLQARGERVAFVGDGINDAPALTQADLGIAVSRASDVAREAADIILLHSDIEAVPEALALARATLRVIRQNLFWAFFYNALGVPLAALGFISPVFCAAAMGGSDLIVIGNALRLLRRGAAAPRRPSK